MEINDREHRFDDKERRFDINPDHPGIGSFEDYFIYNSEVCSNCFTIVRDVGPEYTKQVDAPIDPGPHHQPSATITINAWYLRTDDSVRGHHPEDAPSDRFGQTFCENCGHDLAWGDDPKPLDELIEDAKRIARYTVDHTPLTGDWSRFGDEVRSMKRDPDKTGRETQILAVAFARSTSGHGATVDGDSKTDRLNQASA